MSKQEKVFPKRLVEKLQMCKYHYLKQHKIPSVEQMS